MADILEKILAYAGEKGQLVRRHDVSHRTRRYRIVSVDDHVLEPPHTFIGHAPAKFRGRVPRVERDDRGIDYWVIGEERVPLPGADGYQGWESDGSYLGPVNFDELHPAVYDIHERVRHMDVTGTLASLNFPSAPFGFAGTAFLRMKDRDAGFAALRAYNDWHCEEWAAPYPDRIIPCQLTWLADPDVAADEIRRNAERGFKAISFSENPERLGLPSLYTEHWDPVFRACEETETVVNLHVGSSSETIVPSAESPAAVLGALFALNSMISATDWLFAQVLIRFPNIKIAMSEGGIGWVPMLIDRLNFLGRQLDYRPEFGDLSPIEDAFDEAVDGWVPAAGILWFVTLFGRDALLVSLQTLSLSPRFALGSLPALGVLQAETDDAVRDMEPGKIPHEGRHGELAALKLVHHAPYYGTHDATSLYVLLAARAWRWHGDRDALERVRPHVERALAWIDRDGDRDGDGLQEYRTRAPHGYYNQGWKDAGDAIVTSGGEAAGLPIALCELQGLVVAAKRAWADVLGDVYRDAPGGGTPAQQRRPALPSPSRRGSGGRTKAPTTWDSTGTSGRSTPWPPTPASCCGRGPSFASEPGVSCAGCSPMTCGAAGGSARSQTGTPPTTRSPTSSGRSGPTTMPS